MRSRLRTGPTCKGYDKGVGREAPQQFTPASASWLNLDERWFAELTHNEFKRGVHRCVQALEHGIRSWLADWNERPRRFARAKAAEEILDKAATYCRRTLDSGH